MKKFKNIMLKTKQSQGFTLIEVSLFLALTGVVIIGVLGIFSNISKQRYNDSVQNFAEYLRGIYSQTENVVNNGTNCKCTGASNTCCGQTKTAIYGKIATITSGADSEKNDHAIGSYTVIGNAHISSELFEFKDALGDKGAKIVLDKTSWQSHTTLWQATIQLKRDDGTNINNGSILIARSPNSGVIHTYFKEEAINNNSDLSKWLKDANNTQNINFCVKSPDDGGSPRNVRIVADAHNASGVELMPADEDPICKK